MKSKETLYCKVLRLCFAQFCKAKITLLLFISFIGVGCMSNRPIVAPKAKMLSHTHTQLNVQRNDPYFWLNKREDPEVIEYLNLENQYTDAFFSQNKQLTNDIYKELISRINEDDQSVPVPFMDYLFYSKTFKGKQYPAYYRKYIPTQKEELLIDVNNVAQKDSYTQISWPNISPNKNLMAYAWDKVGRRIYNIHFKDLTTQKDMDVVIENTTGNFVWANDNEHIFYTQQDPVTLRSNKVFRYNIKTRQNELVYNEVDETFRVWIMKGPTRELIYIVSDSTESSEVQFLNANQPLNTFTIIQPREKNHLYDVREDKQNFYILSNWKASNFRVFTAPIPQHSAAEKTNITHKKNWKEIIPHNPKVYINSLQTFANHFVIEYRESGLNKLKIFSKDLKSYTIPFQDEAYQADIGSNLNFETDIFRFTYESKVQPLRTIDINMKTHEQTVVDTKKAPNYDQSKYKTQRVWATARDGEKVPVTLLMLANHQKNATAPALVYAYGSYGAVLPINFSSTIFSLIDRGFIYAFAHIRGGADLGREWYYNGRQLKKKNTFTDFIDVTEFLIKDKYVNPKKIFAMGGSAGGLLMGAITNMRPDLYRGIVAQVPFVDVVTTMLDDSIPLTTSEYDEWGNPNQKKFFDYMLSYSPYDNVVAKKYPNMYITTGLHDSQVQYWEPAKWIARLREVNQSSSLIMMKTNMIAGHGGASGRYSRYQEIAEEFSFIVKMLDDTYDWQK